MHNSVEPKPQSDSRACFTHQSLGPQEERRGEPFQHASRRAEDRRLSAADVFRVRRRNAELLRRRRSYADAAEERAAAQQARMRRLTEQVHGTSLCLRDELQRSGLSRTYGAACTPCQGPDRRQKSC